MTNKHEGGFPVAQETAPYVNTAGKQDTHYYTHKTEELRQPLQIVTDAIGVTLVASPVLLAVCDAVALARTWFHDGNRTAAQDLGEEGNLLADKWGTRAEILKLLALEMRGYDPKDYCLLAVKPPKNVEDFRLNTQPYDIKAAGVGDPFLKVNEEKRIRYAQANVKILPCQFIKEDTLRLYKPVSAVSVGKWQLRQGHSPYRSIAVSSLTPLASLPMAKAVKHTSTGDVVLDSVLRLFGGTLIGRGSEGAN